MDEGGSYPIARVAASERQGVVNVTADRRDAGGRRRRSKTCNWNRGRGRSFVFASFRACESPIERIKPSTVLHTRLLGGKLTERRKETLISRRGNFLIPYFFYLFISCEIKF